ncbi:Molybdate ABC transporter, ATP-binding protein [Fulvimarina pelagi HTCC2506]|uniref:Molybdate ABC transporter, ATP-binding protein n=1 Tax=Fulvimarina pelagi HTCC2506 TaxID=314231 RepID=Q0G6V7_9HYPH|nr:molybdenum ABC transporter ATP-binding protein [Fulvimarina pelagi]EAU42607.1 Molybdate ABC transporter, ATP-binding protein [Fulvimarina pelagi HTCC2506]
MSKKADMVEVALKGRLGEFSLDVAFTAAGGGVTAIFGRSGSGKTSVLRAIAGLERFEGRVVVAGKVWQDESQFVPPHRRAVGYVFQEASLFAHLSVRKNLTFGARRTRDGVDKANLDRTIDLLGLGPLLHRDTGNLSGGERQRVAMGRAILSRPKILLMDEPLSGLDQAAKNAILPFVEALHASLGIPVLFVSHDMGEVERLADDIVVLENGHVASAGPLRKVLVDRSLGFATERDATAILSGNVIAYDESDGIAELDLGGQRIYMAMDETPEIGTRRRLRIEASDVSLTRATAADSTILNRLDVTILGIETSGRAHVAVLLALGTGSESAFVASVSKRSALRLELRVGERLTAQVKSVSLATSYRRPNRA